MLCSKNVLDSLDQFEKKEVGVNGRLTVTEVARELGVTSKTITRWEKAGKVKRAKRDWRGWRIYTQDELEELRNLVQTVY